MRSALIPLLLATGLLACAGPEPASGGPDADTPDGHDASTDGPAGLCAPSARRCLDDDHTAMCSEDGQVWAAAETCEPSTICLGGRCTSLVPPTGGAPIERNRLLADPSAIAEGWWNAWAIASPLAKKSIEPFEQSPGQLPAGLVFKPLCAAEGFVTAQPRAEGKVSQPRYALLGGYVVSDRQRPVRIKVGAMGGLRLWLNGKLALTTSQPGGARPFKDEAIAAVDLASGVNLVSLVMEQGSEDATGFWLRIHDTENRRIPDLRFATAAANAACSLHDLLRAPGAPRMKPGGFDLTLSPRLAGLAPHPMPDARHRVELRKDSGKAVATLAQGTLTAGEIASGAARLDLTATPAAHEEGASAAKESGKPAAPRKPRPAKLEAVWLVEGDPAPVARVPLWYRGELHEQVRELTSRFAALPPGLPQGSRDSLEHHIRTVVRALEDGHRDEPWIRQRAGDAEKILSVARAGDDPYATKTGVVFRAYRSKLDGELQPYVIYVPASYKADGKPLPMILAAHGLGQPAELALRTVIGEAPDEDLDRGWAARHLPPIADQRAFLVAPWGYGNAGPRPLGEHDTLEVLDAMRAHYRVDDARVALTGYSLGGTVAFVVPLHYPDRFSAAAPLCGYPDLTRHESIRNVPHTPWEDTLIARRYIVNYAENGLHLPLHIVHGDLDGPGRSAVVADRYRELGYSRIFDVQEDLDHNVWDYAYEDGRMIEWLKARRRPEAPAHVRLVTGEYRYDKAFWVRLLAMRDSRAAGEGSAGDAQDTRAGAKTESAAGFADIDARWLKDEGVLRVRTRNVAAFVLDLAPLSVPRGARLEIDGTPLEVGDPSTPVILQISENEANAAPPGQDAPRWTLAASEPTRAGKKRPGVAGPLDDVLRHPQLIVYGTQDPTQTESLRLVAEHWSSYDSWSFARYPIKADVDVTDAELRGRSLVLIGGPAANRVTAALAADLPVRFEAGAITLRGKRYEGEDVGVSLICPNPRDPGEYVVLHAGVGYRGALESRHLPRFVPDWLVYDARITAARGDNLLGKRAVLAGGFFDDEWK